MYNIEVWNWDFFAVGQASLHGGELLEDETVQNPEHGVVLS
jgi:hypothetical protein